MQRSDRLYKKGRPVRSPPYLCLRAVEQGKNKGNRQGKKHGKVRDTDRVRNTARVRDTDGVRDTDRERDNRSKSG